MHTRFATAVFVALLGSAGLGAADNILVASTRSNSIEQFSASGTWLRTFATTGPYQPNFLAQSPVTGEIFVTVLGPSGSSMVPYNTILRYQANGQFDTNWDTFALDTSSCTCTAGTQSLLFDASGNLYVATHFGLDTGEPIAIFKFLAASLTANNPPAEPDPIIASMTRGDQMAFNTSGNLCIAGFIDEDVKCFDTTTGALTQDYYAEIHASSVYGIEPGGLAFDAHNRMYLTSIFTGQVVKELKPGGPIVLLATLAPPPNSLNGNLWLRGANLYVPSYYFSPPTVSTPDAVYEVNVSTGATTNFIVGIAAPGLGNAHLWGANCVIFYNPTL